MGWVAFVLIGGAALALLVAPSMRRRPVLLVAVAPAAAFALSMLAAMALDLVGLGPWPGVAIIQAAVVVGAVARLAMLRSSDSTSTGPAHTAAPDAGPEEHRQRRLAGWLLGTAVLLTLAVWIVPGSPSVPKNRDVQNHAYFVARIAHENSIDPAVVLAESPTSDERVADFYPLAAHSTMATAQRATGADIADMLVVWVVMSTAIALPCGLFALARRLVPDRRAVAGWAALAGACTALFPYQPMVWGGIAFTIGLSLVPGVLALALVAVDRGGRRPVPLLVLAAVAVTGAAMVHTSQAALLALVMGAFLLHDLLARQGRSGDVGAGPAVRWGALAAMCAVLLTPVALGVPGTAERASHEETLAEGPAEVVWRVLAFDVDAGPTQLLMGALALAGIAVAVAARRTRPLRRLGAFLAVMGVIRVVVRRPDAQRARGGGSASWLGAVVPELVADALQPGPVRSPVRGDRAGCAAQGCHLQDGNPAAPRLGRDRHRRPSRGVHSSLDARGTG